MKPFFFFQKYVLFKMIKGSGTFRTPCIFYFMPLSCLYFMFRFRSLKKIHVQLIRSKLLYLTRNTFVQNLCEKSVRELPFLFQMKSRLSFSFSLSQSTYMYVGESFRLVWQASQIGTFFSFTRVHFGHSLPPLASGLSSLPLHLDLAHISQISRSGVFR